MLIKPTIIKFCKYEINEYCKDSISYLEDLNNWKNNLSKKKFDNRSIYLVAADVQGLYPNISWILVKTTLLNAIK